MTNDVNRHAKIVGARVAALEDPRPTGAIEVRQVVVLDQVAVVVPSHDSPRNHRTWRLDLSLVLRVPLSNEARLRDARNAQKMLLYGEINAEVQAKIALDGVP